LAAPLKLHYDVTCLMPEKISGVGVYTKNLFFGLREQGVEITPVIKWSRAMKASHVENHIGVKAKVFVPYSGVFAPAGASVFHGPDFRLMAGTAGFKTAVTVHDLAVFHEGFNAEPFRVRGQKLVRELIEQRPDALVVDCDFIAEELKAKFPEISDRVHTIYLGCDHLSKNWNPPSDEEIYANGGYFLFVGHIEKRKNVENVVAAFESIADKYPQVRLIIVGKDGYRGDIIRNKIKSSRHSQRIDLPGFLSKEALEKLYSGALAFLFPSFYEGFGFPPLEAMSLGCPVITSDCGTMREIAGDAALLCKPGVVESLVLRMGEIYTQPSLRRGLIARGFGRSAEFTWKRAAQGYLELYQSMRS
jgi:glycosyltransferase involved in cell wall biosynthesis